MTLSRRDFLTGTAAIAAMMTIFVAMGAEPEPEKLYRGISYQTWPMEAGRPGHGYWYGSIRGDTMKPLSYWMKYIERFKGLPGVENLKWEMIK